MPRRTVWVREDDVEAFDNIQDRPTWLHLCIKSGPEQHLLLYPPDPDTYEPEDLMP